MIIARAGHRIDLTADEFVTNLRQTFLRQVFLGGNKMLGSG